MQRDEHRRIEPPRNGGALVERQISVVIAGHRDPDAAALHEIVAKLAGEREREILFVDLPGDARRARIAAAMTRDR